MPEFETSQECLELNSNLGITTKSIYTLLGHFFTRSQPMISFVAKGQSHIPISHGLRYRRESGLGRSGCMRCQPMPCSYDEIDSYKAWQEHESNKSNKDCADALECQLIMLVDMHWEDLTLMMNAQRQPLRPRAPSRLVERPPCIAPDSMAPTGCAILYILILRAISLGKYHWLKHSYH